MRDWKSATMEEMTEPTALKMEEKRLVRESMREGILGGFCPGFCPGLLICIFVDGLSVQAKSLLSAFCRDNNRL